MMEIEWNFWPSISQHYSTVHAPSGVEANWSGGKLKSCFWCDQPNLNSITFLSRFSGQQLCDAMVPARHETRGMPARKTKFSAWSWTSNSGQFPIFSARSTSHWTCWTRSLSDDASKRLVDGFYRRSRKTRFPNTCFMAEKIVFFSRSHSIHCQVDRNRIWTEFWRFICITSSSPGEDTTVREQKVH